MPKLLIKIIYAFISNAAIIYVVKEKITINVKNIILFLLLVLYGSIFRTVEYQYLYTIIYYLLYVIIFKIIFDIGIKESIVATSMMMIITFIIDLILTIIYEPFFSINELRDNSLFLIINNILMCVLVFIIMKIKKVKNIVYKIYNKLDNDNLISAWFVILLVVVFSIIEYNLYKLYNNKEDFILVFSLVIIFISLLVIFLNEKNKNARIVSEYDNLFQYVQNFEEWIEREQLNRHEYKNQLAVLRCMTKNKKLNDKIDEILEDNINIEGDVVNSLKVLPKGGIKGLMYYKSAIAKKENINLTIDVVLNSNSIINNLKEEKIKVLCKLIGIYFDNAIEAAKEKRKKAVTVEIYEVKNHVKIIFSNSFDTKKLPKNRNQKGISSKGTGRGNGLYFANKLIENNSWISDRQDVIDKYYIEELEIKEEE